MEGAAERRLGSVAAGTRDLRERTVAGAQELGRPSKPEASQVPHRRLARELTEAGRERRPRQRDTLCQLTSLRRVGGGLLERAEKKKVFADGQDVCIIYDFVAKPPVGPSPTVEWYRVRDGKIGEIRIVFDTRPFAALQEQQ